MHLLSKKSNSLKHVDVFFLVIISKLLFKVLLCLHQQRKESIMKTTSSIDSLPLTKMGVNFHCVFYAVRFYPLGAMKPTFLKCHLNKCHPNHKSKSTAFFK